MKSWALALALCGSSLPALAGAAEADEHSNLKDLERGQVLLELTLPSLANAVGTFDEDGNKESFDDQYSALGAQDLKFRTLLGELTAQYGITDEVQAGVSVPFIQNNLTGTFEPFPGVSGDVDQAGSGIGDISLLADVLVPSGDLTLGGGAFVKLATGKHENLDDDNFEDAELAVGSGNTDVGVHGTFQLHPGVVTVEATGGYILRLKGESDDVEFDLGDLYYLESSAHVWVGPQVAVGAAVLYYGKGDDRYEDPGSGDLENVDNSDASLLSIAPSAIVRFGEQAELVASMRVRRIGTDVSRVSTGIPLSGKNEFYGGFPPFTLTGRVRF